MYQNRTYAIAGRCGGLITAAALALLCACSGGADSSRSLEAQAAAESAAQGQQPAALQTISSDGFTLSVLPETLVENGRSASFEMQIEHQASGAVSVSVSASEASALKALYFTLAYDAGKYSPLQASASGALKGGSFAAQLLDIARLDQPGLVEHGQVLAGYEAEPGLTGSAVLATVEFAAQACKPALRGISSVPEGEAAMSPLTVERYDKDTLVVSWIYSNPGDYDENGEVGIADLSPLGQCFGTKSDVEINPQLRLWNIDGDHNNEISISDLTVIGANLGRRVEGYKFFESSDPDSDYPQEGPADKALAPLAELPFDQSSIVEGFRRRFHRFVDGADGREVYWVVPFSGSEAGQVSNRSDEPNGLGNQPPIVLFTVDTSSGEAPLQVTVDMSESYDPDGSIDNFSVFSQKFQLDSQGAPMLNVVLGENFQYELQVKAVDNEGRYGSSATQLVDVTKNGNHAPLCRLKADVKSGNAPLAVELDLSASTDSDGDIAEYRFEINGDYTTPYYDFETSGGMNPLYSTVFEQPGHYLAIGRVKDSAGAIATSDVIFFTVLDNGNVPPHGALYTKGSTNGFAPFEVTLEPGTIRDDDGEVVKVELDPLGDGNWIEQAKDFEYVQLYTEPGDYKPRLRVTDDQGCAYTRCLSGYIKVKDPVLNAPTAVLKASPMTGIGVLSTTLNASDSFDGNGNIVKFEFDSGDGHGWVDHGSQSQIPCFLVGEGQYSVKVRVTDNEGLSDEASLILTVLDFQPF